MPQAKSPLYPNTFRKQPIAPIAVEIQIKLKWALDQNNHTINLAKLNKIQLVKILFTTLAQPNNY
jgi:hypothetical protein